MKTLPTLEGIREARNQLKGVCKQTPFVKSERLSQQVNASVFLKQAKEKGHCDKKGQKYEE
jgi:threonine dehydratase